MYERDSRIGHLTRRSFLAGGAAAAAYGAAGCAHRGGLGKPPSQAQVAPAATVRSSLKAEAAAHQLLTGFALDVRRLRGSEAYRRVVEEQSSIAVAENAMKWSSLRPAPNQYFFDDADYLLHFAETNRIKLRGHNLCWHEQLPPWFDRVATAGNARGLLVEHIRTVAGRYAGRIHSWDVVNEAVNPQDGRPDGLRNSPWLRLAGEGYIELAFRTAREADPAALLTYNDYDVEGEDAYQASRRSAVLGLLRRLKQRNVPIDAVGIQSHISAGPQHRYGASLQQFVRECGDMGLEVFVTEMDVDDRELPENVAERDAGVAEAYRSYLNTLLREPNVRAVLTWGVDDAQSWLTARKPRPDGSPQRPLLFDTQMRPKPAFGAFVRCLAEARPNAPAAKRLLRGLR